MSLSLLDEILKTFNNKNEISTNKRPKVGLGCFIIYKKTDCLNELKILVGKRKKASGKNQWALPGGHLEFGESWSQCASRETKEETNLNINNNKWEFAFVCNSMPMKNNEKLHYVCIMMKSIYDGKSKIINNEPDKCFGWVIKYIFYLFYM